MTNFWLNNWRSIIDVVERLGAEVWVIYRKVASSNTPHLEAKAGSIRLLMKGIFDSYLCTVVFWQGVDFLIRITHVKTRNCTVATISKNLAKLTITLSVIKTFKIFRTFDHPLLQIHTSSPVWPRIFCMLHLEQCAYQWASSDLEFR